MLSPPRRRLPVLAWAVCLLLFPVLTLPAPAAAQAPAPAADADAARLEAERLEAERVEAERVEAERLAAEQAEADRTTNLGNALDAAAEELAAADGSLISALARRNRAAGDLVVARLDLADAQARVAESQRRVERAVLALAAAAADLEDVTTALGVEAAQAYRAGSTTHTGPMIALEAVVRSRSPREFVDGLAYLRAMLPNRAHQRLEALADQDRAADGRVAGVAALRRAEDDVRSAEEDLRAAEAEVPRAETRFAGAVADHAARTTRLVRYAEEQRAATQSAPPTPSTDRNVELADELVALATTSAEAADRLRRGSARIEAGKDGVEPWRALRCPVDGPTRFVNDWGFPRTGGRSHEGTDVFAEKGTPVVAMADAVVAEVSRVDAGLGGRTVSYELDGYRIYNAHLDTVADLEAGDELTAGQVIGTVGTTGNARGTPPHNHVGMYKADGPPVNPYPLLRRACR